jgi:excinuclease ABC subunit A
MLKNISIRGAREHNLKNIDVEIPRDTLTVLTGLSGSGKSSLAFDTIYAEGQRRYVESLSAYARQFLELMQKPDVDHIEGLSPAISIEQKTTSKNPRSTVGTVTEIYDYLRLLFARVGVPYSPATGLPIESQTVSQMADRILALPEGTRLYLLAPIVRGRKGEYRKELAELQKKGFQRVKVDGKFYDIGASPALDKKLKHDIEIVIDRIVVKPDIGNRAEPGRRPVGGRVCRREGEGWQGAPDAAVVQIRLPGLRLHHSRNRAPAVFLQQSPWRLPGMRRAGGAELFRRGSGGAR